MNLICLDLIYNYSPYSTSPKLLMLSHFLLDDIGGRPIDTLISWIKNDNYNSVVLNYSFIKKSNNNVTIYCFNDGYEREINQERYSVEISICELIEIAKQWEELYKKYTFIKIIDENNKISLTGSRERWF